MKCSESLKSVEREPKSLFKRLQTFFITRLVKKMKNCSHSNSQRWKNQFINKQTLFQIKIEWQSPIDKIMSGLKIVNIVFLFSLSANFKYLISSQLKKLSCQVCKDNSVVYLQNNKKLYLPQNIKKIYINPLERRSLKGSLKSGGWGGFKGWHTRNREVNCRLVLKYVHIKCHFPL